MTKSHYAKILAYRRYDPVGRAKWQAIRKKVYDRDGGICRMCGRPCEWSDYQCHHQTYDHVMEEDRHLGDLCVLHEKCHKRLHSRRGSLWIIRRRGFCGRLQDEAGRFLSGR